MRLVALRPAMMADADFLLQLRNDPETQRWLPQPGLVGLDAHREWLQRTLSHTENENGVFLVGEVGTVRMLHRWVSLTVAPEHRGKGYAVLMLNELARRCVGRAPYLDAKIARANERSLRAFARARYEPSHADSTADWIVMRRTICHLCYLKTPHHQIAEASIGGPRTRTIYDLHEVEDASGVGLQECTAAHFFDQRLAP